MMLATVTSIDIPMFLYMLETIIAPLARQVKGRTCRCPISCFFVQGGTSFLVKSLLSACGQTFCVISKEKALQKIYFKKSNWQTVLYWLAPVASVLHCIVVPVQSQELFVILTWLFPSVIGYKCGKTIQLVCMPLNYTVFNRGEMTTCPDQYIT